MEVLASLSTTKQCDRMSIFFDMMTRSQTQTLIHLRFQIVHVHVTQVCVAVIFNVHIKDGTQLSVCRTPQ